MKRFISLVLILFLCGIPVGAQKRDAAKVKTLVIDPGHGGNKPGAIGKRSQEKDVVLSISKKFGKLVKDNYPDVNVVFTRTTDIDIALSERAHVANSNKADLFVSIHANSHPTSVPTGVETFVMGLSKSKANMDVAKKENADILLEDDYKNNSAYRGFDPNAPESSIIFSLFQSAYIDKSLNFASFVQSQYCSSIKTVNRGVKQAEFMVLYMTAMPSVLTEVGFISNPAEEAFMMSDAGQAQIAVCLFNAFATYKNKEDGTPVPSKPKIDLPGYGKNAVCPPSQETSSPVRPAGQRQDVPTDSLHTEALHPVADSLAKQSAPTTLSDTLRHEVSDSATVAQVSAMAPTKPAPEMPVFKVQFLTADHPLPSDARQLRGQTDFETYSENGVVRYLKGNASSIKEAKQIQTELREVGFKDAFVIAFYQGRKISIQQARELLNAN